MSSRSISFGHDSHSLDGVVVVVDDTSESRSRGEKSFSGSMEEFLDGSHFLSQTSVFSEATPDSNDSSLLPEQFCVEKFDESAGKLGSHQDLSTMATSGRKRYSRRQDQRQRETLVNLSLAEESGLSASQITLGEAKSKPGNSGQNRIDTLSKISHEVKVRAERRREMHSEQPCVDFRHSSAPELFRRETHAMTVVFNKSSHRTSTAMRSNERYVSRTRSIPSLQINRPQPHGSRRSSIEMKRWAERRSSLPSQNDLNDITLIALGRNLRKPDQMSFQSVVSEAVHQELPHLEDNERNVTLCLNADQAVNVSNEMGPPGQAKTTIPKLAASVTPRVSPLKDKAELPYSDFAIDQITVFDSFRSFLHQVGMNTDFAAETGK